MYTKLEPVQKRQKELQKKKEYIYDILRDGKKRAKKIAEETMNEVYEKLGIKSFH